MQPTGLIAIPPLARTVIYYVLALAHAVVVPLIAAGVVDAIYGAIVLGVASVFGFALAGGNVPVADGYQPERAIIAESNQDELPV